MWFLPKNTIQLAFWPMINNLSYVYKENISIMFPGFTQQNTRKMALVARRQKLLSTARHSGKRPSCATRLIDIIVAIFLVFKQRRRWNVRFDLLDLQFEPRERIVVFWLDNDAITHSLDYTDCVDIIYCSLAMRDRLCGR